VQDIKNKVVVITGSSQGIGLQTALKFGREGARVVMNGRNAEKLTKATQLLLDEGIEVVEVCSDISTSEGRSILLKETIRHFGQLDVLIHNASTFMNFAVKDASERVMQQVLDTNFVSPIQLTREALPFIVQKKGSVIFVSSVASFMGIPRHSAYSATKMGLTALSQALRVEMKPEGVHIGIIYVGFTKNDPTKTELDAHGKGVKMSPRPAWLQAEQSTVAKAIFNMVIKRQSKRKMGVIGHITQPFVLMFPRLTDYFLSRTFKKNI
jgi:short-subunit dehydrogenase